jgi:predicted Zn finger-like uncharacterized protein
VGWRVERLLTGNTTVPKDHIEIRCPHCASKMAIGWPTPRARRAQVRCSNCNVDFSVAEAVERAIVGKSDHRDLHIVPRKADGDA